MGTMKHPAKFTDTVLDAIVNALRAHAQLDGLRVLDPFAGTGRIHELRRYGCRTVGVELEPEWANMSEGTLVGDATCLPIDSGSIEAVVTSPCYGNRMADKYAGDAKGSRRHTYRIDLGRMPSEGSAAVMHWGPAYRELHRAAWSEAYRVLQPGGLLVLNISDHLKLDVVQPVSTWHVAALCEQGFMLEDWQAVPTPRQRHGANGDKRMPNEWVFTFRRGI